MKIAALCNSKQIILNNQDKQYGLRAFGGGKSKKAETKTNSGVEIEEIEGEWTKRLNMVFGESTE